MHKQLVDATDASLALEYLAKLPAPYADSKLVVLRPAIGWSYTGWSIFLGERHHLVQCEQTKPVTRMRDGGTTTIEFVTPLGLSCRAFFPQKLFPVGPRKPATLTVGTEELELEVLL